MTTALDQRALKALRRAAIRATMAPSVHNTQPWQFVISGGRLAMRTDRTRQLRVLDPTGRQMVISCGCALFNARVACAADGYLPHISRQPEGSDSDLFARLSLGDAPAVLETEDDIGGLDAVVELRQTNRRRFADEAVPDDVVDVLVRAAAMESSILVQVTRPEHRLAVATLSQKADALQNANPAYRAEIRAWTTDDPTRRDGIPAMAVPHVDAGSEDEVPIRDFDMHGNGWLPTATHSTKDQCLLLLGTEEDTPKAWLRAGEALERILLEITKLGYAASPLTQVVEIPTTREALRQELALGMHPHVLLRVGRAPLTPATRRRKLSDVLFENE